MQLNVVYFVTDKNKKMKQKIYLAGGIRSDWQKYVIHEVDADFYNPRSKEIDRVLTLTEFGSWDLHYIKKCDIVFAYMEKDNPSGIGMAVEMGYAKGLNKTVILCLEQNNNHIKDRYLDFMRKVSDVVYDNLEDAIKYLSLYK